MHRQHANIKQVAALKDPLTDADEDEQRGKAVQLIAQVAGLVQLKPEEVDHLAEFFSSKLADWCARAAVGLRLCCLQTACATVG